MTTQAITIVPELKNPTTRKDLKLAVAYAKAQRPELWRELLDLLKNSELTQSILGTIAIELLQQVSLGKTELRDTLFGFIIRERTVDTKLISDNLAFVMEAAIWSHYALTGAAQVADLVGKIKR